MNNDYIFFRETQKFRQWWLWLIIAASVSLSLWAFIQQIIFRIPFGSNPAPDLVVWIILFFFGLGLPLFFLSMTMTTTVFRDKIIIRFFPLMTRIILLNDIVSFRATGYRPIRDFGGWGIRWGRNGRVAYNVRGHEGVEVALKTGPIILIGSGQASELEAAIRRVKTQ